MERPSRNLTEFYALEKEVEGARCDGPARRIVVMNQRQISPTERIDASRRREFPPPVTGFIHELKA
jgi:hypothetical protein